MAGRDFSWFQQSGVKLTKAEIKKIEKEIVSAYKASLKKVQKDIAAFYAKNLVGIDPEDYYINSIKFDRLSNLEKKIQKDLKELGVKTSKLTADASELAFSNNYYRQEYVTNWLAPYSFTELNPNALQYAVYQRQESFKKLTQEVQQKLKLKYGGTLSEVLKSNNTKAITKINQTLNRGLIEGLSYNDMAKDMKDAFGNNLNNSLRVANTETHRTLNQGQMMQLDDARKKGVVAKRMILSVLDLRTRAQSVEVDGNKENKDGFFVYPGGILVSSPGNSGFAKWDVNDRETVINIIDDKPPALRRGKNPVTNESEVFSFKDYNTWAKDNGLKKSENGTWRVPKK